MAASKSGQSDLELVLAAELLYLAGDMIQVDGRIAHLLRARALEIESIKTTTERGVPLPAEPFAAASEKRLH